MKSINRFSISIFVLILILCLSLTNASPALADEGQPTEPPTATEVATEEPQPSEPPVTADPEGTGEETLSEVLTELPEGTDVVVLDENGEALPLASQEAAEIVAIGDPMWCPAGTLPGGTGCTTNYLSIDLLVDELTGFNKPNYMQDGVIYFTAGSAGDSFVLTNGSIGATDFQDLNDYGLTLQGGWNGLNLGAATFAGTTDFGSNYIQIGTNGNRWVGNLALYNFTFSGVGGAPDNANAITIYTTTGSITLDNVNVANQTNDTYTALLTSTSGNITVDDSSFDGNTSDQSKGFVALTGGNIVISDTVFQESRRSGDNTYKGADLTGSTVSLTNVTATNNDGNGIDISGAGTVTLNQVIATFNGTDPATGANLGSGLKITGTGSTIVNVTGGTFSNNYRYGIELYSGTLYQLSAPTCAGNVLSKSCYNVTPASSNTAPSLILPGTLTVEATSNAGAAVTFSVSATDVEDKIDPTPSCNYASGTTFPLGTTTVNCSVTDSGGVSSSGSFDIIVQDTIPPVIEAHGDLEIEITSGSGLSVNYLEPGTTDIVDGSDTASCLPASGSTFPIGTTPVTCTATDTHENSATPTTFNVKITLKTASSGGTIVPVISDADGAQFTNLFIPITGGNTFNIACVAPDSFQIESRGHEIVFKNLCGYEAYVEGLETSTLPGGLPNGTSFLGGFTINITEDGQAVNPLPADAGVSIDFKVPASLQNANFAVYQWDGTAWVEVAGEKTDSGFYSVDLTEGGTFIFVQK